MANDCLLSRLVEEQGEGVEAEDDARHVLAVVHVRRLGGEHLGQTDVADGLGEVNGQYRLIY